MRTNPSLIFYPTSGINRPTIKVAPFQIQLFTDSLSLQKVNNYIGFRRFPYLFILRQDAMITLAHGAGGAVMHKMIKSVILKHFNNSNGKIFEVPLDSFRGRRRGRWDGIYN